MTPRDPLAPVLEFATPERVSLILPLAGFGHRALAYLVDVAAQFGFWATVYFSMTLLVDHPAAAFSALSGTTVTVLVVGLFLTQWVYWTASELLLHGQTLGKRVVGLRVVREDGAPVDFLSSAVRNLLRAVDFLPLGYALGGLSVLLTERRQRVGDVVAGTVVAVEAHRVSLPPMHCSPKLTSKESELVLEFVSRLDSLTGESQRSLSKAFLLRFAKELPDAERQRLVDNASACKEFLRQRALGAS